MSKRMFPAAAEGMPNFNRRTFLRGMGSATAVAGVVAAPAVAEAVISAQAENPELLRLHEELTARLQERAAAEAEIARIADEWRDRWPLAPEDLLGIVIMAKERAYDDGMWRAERDIAGEVLFRDPSMLSRRTSRRYRDDLMAAPVAFYIEKTDHIEKQLRDWENMPPKGRTPAALARNTKWVAGVISDYRSRLHLARQYDVKTARFRKISGMDAAKQRRARANENLQLARELLSEVSAWTQGGLALKARVMRGELDECALGSASALFEGTALGRMRRLVLQMADA